MLGAPKCGTTALANYLVMHPSIQVSEPKEPNHFCKDLSVGGLPEASDEEYLATFFPELDNSNALVALDASVWYLYSRVAIEAILQFQPNARFLVMLRNPVDMAYSLHSMLYFMRQEDVSDFSHAWSLEKERRQGRMLPSRRWIDAQCLQYKAVCSLGTQLKSLFDKVPETRVHVEFQEDLQSDARGVYERVLRFMGVPDDGRDQFRKFNAGRQLRSRFLASALRSEPALHTANTIKRVSGLKTLGFGRPDVPMKPEQRRFLVQAFCEEISLLEQLLERNLSHWRHTKL